MRDHRLGFPAALLADTPAANTARYPLGRPKRDPEPQTWPFPLVKPAVTFVADSRTMDSDRPQPVVLGVDMGKPGGDETLIALRSGSVLNLYDATSWVSVSGGFTWDASSGALIAKPSEPEKPAQGEPQFKVGDTVISREGHRYVLTRQRGEGEVFPGAWLARLETETYESAVFDEHELQPAPPATPQPDAEGWIEHDGGPCPEAVVAARSRGQEVFVRFRSGEVNRVNSSIQHSLDVVFKPLPSVRSLDVLAYRVVSA